MFLLPSPSIKPKIIDSHMHFWDLSQKKHPWLLAPGKEFFLGDYTALRKSYLLEDYLADSADWEIEKVVAVQGGWKREDWLGEAKWLTEINPGLIGAIVAYADLAAPNAQQQLEALAEIPLVRGIRQIVAWHRDPYISNTEIDYLQQKIWRQNFKLLAKHNYIFDLQIYPEQADDAYSLLKENIEIPVVIEHGLQPLTHGRVDLKFWESKLKKLAQLPQVCIKISGLNLFVHNTDIGMRKRLFETIVEHFSPARCMVASNFPVEKLFISFADLYEQWWMIASQYTQVEREALFCQTAKQFYNV